MKPIQARAARKAREATEERRRQYVGDALAAYDGDTSIVVPDLIPTTDDAVAALRDVRKLAKQADRATATGPRRKKLVTDLMVAIGRLIYIERVMALDDLARAALTPGQLWMLSHLSPQHLRDRVALLHDEKPDSGLVLP